MLLIRHRYWILAIVVAFAAGCTTPVVQDADPDPIQDLIVSAERIGDLSSIGTAGSVIREMPGAEAQAVSSPARTQFYFRDGVGDLVHAITVCESSDVVSEIYIFNHPDNERFVTADGLSVLSSESEVLATAGTPDRTLETTNTRLHDYAPVAEGWYGLGFSFWKADLSSTYFVGVRGSCE